MKSSLREREKESEGVKLKVPRAPISPRYFRFMRSRGDTELCVNLLLNSASWCLPLKLVCWTHLSRLPPKENEGKNHSCSFRFSAALESSLSLNIRGKKMLNSSRFLLLGTTSRLIGSFTYIYISVRGFDRSCLAG